MVWSSMCQYCTSEHSIHWFKLGLNEDVDQCLFRRWHKIAGPLNHTTISARLLYYSRKAASLKYWSCPLKRPADATCVNSVTAGYSHFGIFLPYMYSVSAGGSVLKTVEKLSISNFSCSLTRNMALHSIKNLAFHSLLRWKSDYTTNSNYLTHTFP